jgi:hypothetical protein
MNFFLLFRRPQLRRVPTNGGSDAAGGLAGGVTRVPQHPRRDFAKVRFAINR